MNTWLDQSLVAGTIMAAAGYLLFRFRRKKAGKACGSGCCTTSSAKPVLRK
jgi:LPXTG-motif cell wall-anchored protein